MSKINVHLVFNAQLFQVRNIDIEEKGRQTHVEELAMVGQRTTIAILSAVRVNALQNALIITYSKIVKRTKLC